MEGAGALLYVALKLAAYIGWCILGVRVHGPRERFVLKGVLYGVLRAVMGLVFGLVAILFLVNLLENRVTRNSIVLYLAVYIPVRWVEWSLMAILMDRGHRTFSKFLVGKGSGTRLWRLGGIVISCLADIPMLLDGLPVGRFMC